MSTEADLARAQESFADALNLAEKLQYLTTCVSCSPAFPGTHPLCLFGAHSNILNEEEPSPEQARIWFE